MKLLKLFIIAFAAILLIVPNESFSQKQSKESSFTYVLTDDNNTEHSFEAPGVKFETPSGNFLWTFKVRVPKSVMENIEFSPYANGIKEIFVTIISSGEVLDADGFLNKAGNLNIELHKNGSGTVFPKGWH